MQGVSYKWLVVRETADSRIADKELLTLTSYRLTLASGADNPETAEDVPFPRAVATTLDRTRAKFLVVPVSAAQYATGAGDRGRAGGVRLFVAGITVPPVPAPLIHVPAHVVQPKAVSLLFPYFMRP